jgi:hypothetical protein
MCGPACARAGPPKARSPALAPGQRRRRRRLDPATGEVLPGWDQALDELGDQPHHVAGFGDQFKADGVLAGSKDAARCIGYLTKYLTKQVGL